MKGFEANQQLDIFNLDVLKPLGTKDREDVNKKRKKNEMKRLYHTLKISKILDNNCKDCKNELNDLNSDNINLLENYGFFNDLKELEKNKLIKCLEIKEYCNVCPYYKELLEHGRGIQETTKNKIHKESWENDRNYKKDQTRERLFTYELLNELEKDYTPEEILEKIKYVPMFKLAEEIDCEYNVMKSFVNKYRKMKL